MVNQSTNAKVILHVEITDPVCLESQCNYWYVISALTSPTCDVSPHSASGSEPVTFTCAVTVCGNASIPVNIKRSGSSVESGTNNATWTTTADNVTNVNVTCSANFGDAVKCEFRKGMIDS